MQEAVIPFSGFYESDHDAALDCALEQMLQDDRGDVYQDLFMPAFDDIDWGKVHVSYAKEYVEHLSHVTDHKFEFVELVSPREYNFTTDRIFVKTELRPLLVATPIETIRKAAAELFTSRSGFHSFYSPDIDTWGPLEDWDYNQALALTGAWLHTHHRKHERDIAESMREALENLVYAAGGRRLARCTTVAYLRRERSLSATDFHNR